MVADFEFAPSLGDQIIIMGGTGSGKSTLAAILVHQEKRVVIIDAKHRWTLPGFQIVKLPPFVSPSFGPALRKALAWSSKPKRIILRLAPEDVFEEDPHEAIFAEVYRTKDWIVVIDEVAATGASAGHCPKNLKILSALGRTGANVTLISCSQRAFGLLPLLLKDNASWTLFGTTEAQAIQGIKREGIEQAVSIQPKTGVFLCYHQGHSTPYLFRAELPKELQGWEAP